jgi:hypothetical protein
VPSASKCRTSAEQRSQSRHSSRGMLDLRRALGGDHDRCYASLQEDRAGHIVSRSAVLLTGHQPADAELLEVAVQLASARRSNLMLIGMADLSFWAKNFAPQAVGHFYLQTARAGLEEDINRELLRCVELIPWTVSARHAYCTGWASRPLVQLLSECSTLIASRRSVNAYHRRRLRSITRRLDTTLIFVDSHRANDEIAADQLPLTDVARSDDNAIPVQ